MTDLPTELGPFRYFCVPEKHRADELRLSRAHEDEDAVASPRSEQGLVLQSRVKAEGGPRGPGWGGDF